MRRRSNLLAAEAGLALSLGLVLTAFHLDLPAPEGPARGAFHPPERTLFEVTPAPRPVPVREVPPSPPPARPPIERPDAGVVPGEWVDEEAVLMLDAGPVDVVIPPPPTPPDRSIRDAPDEEPVAFLPFEQMPRLLGGIEGLQPRIRYPERCRALGLEGRVILQFVVEKDGTVTDAHVARRLGGGCDEAALAAVRQAQFAPGHQRGRPVRVRMSLPVTFRLR